MVILDKLADNHDNILLSNYIKEQKRALGIPVSPSIAGKSSVPRFTTFNQASIETQDRIQWSDLKSLSKTYWFSCLACCFTYISVINYVMITSAIL